MITSSKTILKKQKQKQKMDRQNSRTNGKSKALQRKSHTESYTYTLTKRKKGKKKYNIYIVAPKVHHLNFGMICCLFRYSTDAGYVKLIV